MRGAPTQQLYAEEHGEGEPLLLLEGLGQSLWAWREQIPVFARHFRTIAFDTRGTGRSAVPEAPYGIDELAQDAADVLDGRTAHIVGLSMGDTWRLRSRCRVRSSCDRSCSSAPAPAVPIACRVLKTFVMRTRPQSGCHSPSTDGERCR